MNAEKPLVFGISEAAVVQLHGISLTSWLATQTPYRRPHRYDASFVVDVYSSILRRSLSFQARHLPLQGMYWDRVEFGLSVPLIRRVSPIRSDVLVTPTEKGKVTPPHRRMNVERKTATHSSDS